MLGWWHGDCGPQNQSDMLKGITDPVQSQANQNGGQPWAHGFPGRGRPPECWTTSGVQMSRSTAAGSHGSDHARVAGIGVRTPSLSKVTDARQKKVRCTMGCPQPMRSQLGTRVRSKSVMSAMDVWSQPNVGSTVPKRWGAATSPDSPWPYCCRASHSAACDGSRRGLRRAAGDGTQGNVAGVPIEGGRTKCRNGGVSQCSRPKHQAVFFLRGCSLRYPPVLFGGPHTLQRFASPQAQEVMERGNEASFVK